MGGRGPRFRRQGRLTYLRELATFACGAQLRDLGADVLARTRWLVADTLPVIAAGMQQPEMQALSSRHLATAAAGKAWVPGTGKRAGALDAALLNGTAGTCLELNEGNLYAKGHPGIQVVPAAIALAQEMDVSGAELLMAIAVGYETGSRISSAAKMKLAVHPHGTWGVVCAAVAAARLKRFNEGRLVERSASRPAARRCWTAPPCAISSPGTRGTWA
jgi:2-methylcitrate dehydratase PrpD